MTDQEKLKAIMEEHNLNFHKIADITGHTYMSVKTILQPNKPVPRWIKLLFHVWEQSKRKNSEK